MKKISKTNRKFFLKWLPFNFCDRHCERCEEFKNECKIYSDEVQFQMNCLREGRDPDDLKVVFEYVGKNMAKTMAMIKADMKKRGIELTRRDINEYDRKQAKEDKFVRNHNLYKQCSRVSRELHDFLTDFQVSLAPEPLIIATLEKELNEISFYGHLIFVKSARALHSKIGKTDDSIKFSRPDYLVSGTLAYYSLLTVEKSLKNIREIMRNSQPIWFLKINSVLREIEKAKPVFRKTFPKIECFRDKVIFHGYY